jgi:UDP-N-acetylmuramoylalanine--D-glutamate ligase
MTKDLSSAGVTSEICDSLEETVRKSKEATKKGETILFSPACQSFGEFKDYRERALAFNKVVEEIFK